MLRPRAVLGSFAALVLAASAGAAARVPDGLAARAAGGERVRVLVALDVPFVPEGALAGAMRAEQRTRIAAAQASLVAHLAGTTHRVVRSFRAIPFAALEVEAAALEALARSPSVRAVTADDLHAPFLDGTVPLVQADQTRAVGFDGAGQTIAVIDTGVDGAHPNLAGKIVGEACFASGAPGPFGDCPPNGSETQGGPGSGSYCSWSSECFHGTHVAGIAAGDGPSYDGVAPGAALVSIQVASKITSPTACSPSPAPCPRAYESDVIAALEEVYDFGASLEIPAVNVSLGGQTYTSQSACDADNAAYKAAIDNLRSENVATVIAAGNDGLTNGLAEPACISTAVSVSATHDNDTISSWPNRASFLSLWAPGVSIWAPYYQSTGYVNASGTSMAAPHAAGAWAILREAVPDAGVDEILLALQATGVPIIYTTRIRIRDALEEVAPACANGFDDDGDGYVDFPDDPGCASLSADAEQVQCQDGLDNDGDGGVDFDGGASLNGGVPVAAYDATCAGAAWKNREKAGSCGLGFELAPLLAVLWLRRRRA